MKHKSMRKEKDPLDREIKWLLTITLIAFLVFGTMPYLQAHFIDVLIQYADAAQFHIPPDFAGSTTQGGISVTCPQITSPSSATGSVVAGNGAGSGWASYKQSTTTGCTFSAYVIEDGLFPEEFAHQQSPVPALNYLLTPTTRLNSLGCQMFDLDDLTIPGSTNLVDPRLNITATYDSIRNGATLTTGYIRCSFTASYQPEQRLSTVATYNSRDNQTWYSWGMAESGFNRPSLLASRSLAVSSIEQKWALPIPANHTSNYWQMQEHPMYSGTYPVISDGFFGIDGNTFTMDSGSTNAQRGEVVLFKAFNKTELSQNVVPVDNLIAYYTFEESSGSLINEAGSVGSGVSFGTAADGSVGGSITRGHNGIIGSSYEFPGLSGGQITLGSSVSQFNFLHNTTAKWTMNFWENSTSASGSTAIIQNNVGTTGNRGMDLAYNGAGGSSGTSSLITRGILLSALAGVSTAGTLPNGVWNMVTYTFDYNGGVDTGSNHKVYVNGVLQTSAGFLMTPAMDGNAPVALQMGGFGGLLPYFGKLDEFSIWNDELSTTEITDLYNGGSGLALSTTTGGDLPDIRVQGAIESVGSSSGSHIHIEVKDGNFQAGQTEGLNAIGTLSRKDITEAGNSDDVAYFERNQYMTYMNSTRDTLHSLGVYDLEDPTVGTANNFDISFAPNWSNSTSDIITVFVAVQDNSTTGSMIANVTSIELENKLKYNFTDITDFVFWEPNCAEVVGSDSPQTDGGVSNAYNCNEDVSNGLTQIQNVTAGNITSNVLPTPNQVQNVTLAETDSILVDWDHNLVNVTGFRIYRTSTESGDTESYINGLPSGSNPDAGCLNTPFGGGQACYLAQGGSAFGMDLAGKIVSDMTWRMNRIGTVTDSATFKGAVFNSVINAGSDVSSVVNSTESYSASSLPSSPAHTNYYFSFRPPVNSTDNNDGVGLIVDGLAGVGSYSIGVESDNGQPEPRGRNFDNKVTSTTWAVHSSDWVIDVNEVNQTKLFYNPYLLNSGNLTTSYVDENVTTGNTYFYRVVALNGNIESDGQIFNYTIIPAPGPVTGLTATALNSTAFIDWNNVANVNSYTVLRSESSPGSLVLNDNFVTNDWNTTNTNVIVNTTSQKLDFDVSDSTLNHQSAYDLGSNLNATNWILRFKLTVDHLVQGVDNTPVVLSVGIGDSNENFGDSSSQDMLGLRYLLNNLNNEYDIFDTDNQVPFATGADSAFTHTPITETLYTEIELTSATTYQVTFFNDTLYSNLIETQSGSTTATNFRYVKVFSDDNGDGTEDHTYDGTIDNLQVFNSTTNSFQIIADGVIPSQYTDYTVTPDTPYFYAVYSVNNAGNSSATVSNQVITNDVSSAPYNLTAAMGLVIPDLEDVFLNWNAPLDNGTGSPSTGADIIKYQVERKAGLGPFSFLANTTNATSAYEDETVISSANYTWRVRAVNPVGFSPYSNIFSLITTPLMVPNPPTNLTATAISGYKINVDWLAGVGGDPVISYVLQQRHVGFTGFVTIATIPAPTLFYNVTGLLPGNTYDYRVRADNGAGSSAYSNIDQAVTFNVPSAPQTLNAVTFNNTRIDLTWLTPVSVGSGIDNYTIEKETPVGGGFFFEANTTNLFFSSTSLTQNTVYNYRVKAANDIGYGAYSNQDNDRTQGIPDAPINLSYTTNGISTITVDWDSPVYTGGVPLTAYTIEQAQGIGGTFFNAIPNHAVIPSDNTFIGLLQSTNYIYKIAAKNQYGTGSYSANLTAGTFGGPSEPENFLAVFNSTFPYSVNLSWLVPLDDGGEPIQGYIIQRKNLQNVYVQIANVTNSTFSFTDSSLLQLATHVYRIAAFGSVGDFTADQPVTTVVQPHFQTFTIDDFDVLGDVLHQNYTVVIDDCFPACVLTQADIERNGIVESNYVVGSSIPLNTPVTFNTYFIIPLTGTQLINTTAIVTNLGSNNSNETGVVTAQLQFVVPTLFFNHTRVNNFQDINFTIVRHPIPWSAECTHVISSTFLNPTIGISGTQPNLSLQNIGSYNGLFNANPSLNSYIACYDPVNTQILAFTSFGSGNGTLALTTFTNQLGDFMGVPVPFIFVLFFAAIWTGRSAPTGIIMLAVVIGFLGVLGYFDPLSGSPTQTQSLEAFWGLIVILTLLGVFIGKRFF